MIHKLRLALRDAITGIIRSLRDVNKAINYLALIKLAMVFGGMGMLAIGLYQIDLTLMLVIIGLINLGLGLTLRID